MEVYQAPPQHPRQQYYANPLHDDVEKTGSIHSGHHHQLHPYTHSAVNLSYGHGHGHTSPMNPGTPVNYNAGHPPPPLTSHISTSSSSTRAKEMASHDKKISHVSVRLAGCVLAIIVILFAAVIGLAAGLGMTQENLRQARSDLLLAQAKLVAPGTGTAANSPPSDATTTSTPATVTATIVPTPTAQAAIKCPAGNGTFYSTSSGDSSGPTKQFQRICGIDYGQGEAKDIGSKKVASLDECMDACAARAGCTGAGWGAITGDKGNMHSCWMKTGLIKPHKATQDWGFGLLITGSGAGNSSST
ncbi:hypothetical protein QBC37DRAFT_11444 [Rhypophila decipiens]|uniref:Apple domain-containing protein n=1 Tax=Rhypophila decipiens TaxID=261697 RepID=A0AAN6Y4F2_9PEZI|nr:hypothetical protein QBC37DRAFT_11444 [Rhypophila decipiens]